MFRPSIYFEEPDGGAGGGAEGGVKDAAYWEGEAKKAFQARQEQKKQAEELRKQLDGYSGIDPAEYRALKDQAAKDAEARKRKEGEFDAWRAEETRRHTETLAAEAQRREAAEAKLKQKLIGLEFAGASSLFGENGKTVLTPEIAEAYLGRFVDVETDDSGRERVVVKNADGHVILNSKTGKPASFVEALDEVINTLPNKERILRGSGKAGSGSSGGKTVGRDIADLTTLIARAQGGDKEAIAALKARRANPGRMQMGSAFSR